MHTKTYEDRRLAGLLGVHYNSVSSWRRNRTLPKNPLIRERYLALIGKKPKAKAKAKP